MPKVSRHNVTEGAVPSICTLVVVVGLDCNGKSSKAVELPVAQGDVWRNISITRINLGLDVNPCPSDLKAVGIGDFEHNADTLKVSEDKVLDFERDIQRRQAFDRLQLGLVPGGGVEPPRY